MRMSPARSSHDPAPRTDLLKNAETQVVEKIKTMLREKKDIREAVVEKMAAWRTKVNWRIPGSEERVMFELVAEETQDGRSFTQITEEETEKKGMREHHLGQEWLLHAMLLDRGIKDDVPEWINLKSTEMTGRRWYSIKKAFRRVKKPEDWRKPKNAGKDWASKVEWYWLEELDAKALSLQNQGIEAVDEEVRERLRRRAIQERALVGGSSGVLGADSSVTPDVPPLPGGG